MRSGGIAFGGGIGLMIGGGDGPVDHSGAGGVGGIGRRGAISRRGPGIEIGVGIETGVKVGIDLTGRRDVFRTIGVARDEDLDVGRLVGRGRVVEPLQASDLALGGEGQSQGAGALRGQAGALDLFGDELAVLEVITGISLATVVGTCGSVRSRGALRDGSRVGGVVGAARLAGAHGAAADEVVLASEDLGLEGHFALVGVPGGSGDGALALDGAHEVHIAVDAMLGADLLAVGLEVVADGAGG